MRDKRILLVTVPIMDELDGKIQPIMMDKTRSNPPTGAYLLAAILKRSHITFRFLDLIAGGVFNPEHIDKELENADIIALPANSLNWPSALLLINRAKQINPQSIIILGNIHGTMFPEYILDHHPVDFILRGEAEMSFRALIGCLLKDKEPDNIPGLCFKKKGSVYIDPTIPTLTEEQLNQNPVPLWDIIPDKAYTSLSIESSRGCKFNCLFCSIPYRRNWRKLSARIFYERYLESIAYTGRTRSTVLSIIDDCFTIDKQRILDIVNLLKNESPPPSFTMDARASDLRDAELSAAIAPYVNSMLVGAELGYEAGLKKIRKGIRLQDIIDSASNLKEMGIAHQTVFSFIIGFPWERYDEVMRTIEFAFELYARHGVRIYLQWHNLIPGSKIWYSFLKNQQLSLSEYDTMGFFRNRKLMGLSIGRDNDEIFKICDRVLSVVNLTRIQDQIGNLNTQSISFSVPWHLVEDYSHYLEQEVREKH